MNNSTAAAKQIRAELKRHGIKASVRSTFDKVNVTLLDASPETAKSVRWFASAYQVGHYNGQTDCYDYSNRSATLPQVRFVFVSVDFSDALKAQAADWFAANGAPADDMIDQSPRAVLHNPGPFWTSRKDRIRAA